MIVCIIAEGSYPYIAGGVASWIHQLITGLPDIKFKVISIMPSKEEKLQSKYEVPSNLLTIKTIFLDSYSELKVKRYCQKQYVSQETKENLEQLLRNDHSLNWQEIIRVINKDREIGNTVEFLQSNFFWESTLKLYLETYEKESFNTFFWTIRTMLLPFLNLLQQPPLEADVYHSVSTGYAGILGASLSELTQKPFLLTEHGIYAREREEEILKAKWVTGIYKSLWIKFFFFLSVIAYRKADQIISLFQRNQAIQMELGAPRDRVKVISNGVNLDKFTVEKETHAGYNVGAVLRVVPIKDVMTLIRAFKIVKQNVEAAKLFLIGPTDEDSEYYQQCLNLTRLLKLEEDVIFTGRVDVKEYFKIIDVMVLTSISEGQPLVILEGMAAKIPIIATDVGSCRELLEEDDFEEACGLVTNLVSPSDTAAQIVKLFNNGPLRTKMGENGRKRVRRIYNEEIFLGTYKEVYQSLRRKLWLASDSS